MPVFRLKAQSKCKVAHRQPMEEERERRSEGWIQSLISIFPPNRFSEHFIEAIGLAFQSTQKGMHFLLLDHGLCP